jgi:4-hydroxythreonine-4-phosphate dehydrogenase
MNQKLGKRYVAVTAGEPAGIGPEICLDLVNKEWSKNIIIIADPNLMQERARILKKNIRFIDWSPDLKDPQELTKNSLYIWPQSLHSKVICGKPNPNNSQILLDGIKQAVSGCMKGIFRAMVTGPVNKGVINQANIQFTGHTEFIARQTNTETPVMLLSANDLRVALVTTHIPLSKVSSLITKQQLTRVIKTVDKDLKQYFKIRAPKILVCGLNPHAGEKGYLGLEEQTIIEPVIKEFRQQGFNITGPVSADTAFLDAENKTDVIIAMYHDQGLPVLKYAGFGNAVNITLGLPIVRVSVDHGTAFDIAGQGKANSDSLINAVELAIKMTS